MNFFLKGLEQEKISFMKSKMSPYVFLILLCYFPPNQSPSDIELTDLEDDGEDITMETANSKLTELTDQEFPTFPVEDARSVLETSFC